MKKSSQQNRQLKRHPLHSHPLPYICSLLSHADHKVYARSLRTATTTRLEYETRKVCILLYRYSETRIRQHALLSWQSASAMRTPRAFPIPPFLPFPSEQYLPRELRHHAVVPATFFRYRSSQATGALAARSSPCPKHRRRSSQGPARSRRVGSRTSRICNLRRRHSRPCTRRIRQRHTHHHRPS